MKKKLLVLLLFFGSCKIAMNANSIAFIGIDDDHTLINLDNTYIIVPIVERQNVVL